MVEKGMNPAALKKINRDKVYKYIYQQNSGPSAARRIGRSCREHRPRSAADGAIAGFSRESHG